MPSTLLSFSVALALSCVGRLAFAQSAPPAAAPPLTVSTKLVSATLYGFIELDAIADSTQSFNDPAGNGAVARSGTFAAEHGRTMFGARNSRLGLALEGPGTDSLKTSGIVEADFLGNQPQSSPAPAGSPALSEAAFFTSPTFRIRHMALKLETPVIDVLAGQYWQLFGWQSSFHPNTVEIQGVPGQIYSRSPQLRLSRTFKTASVNVEIAVAASRPPQRDAAVPDGQAGLRFVLNNWKAMHTTGSTGSVLDGASLGLSTVGRSLRLPSFSPAPTSTVSIDGYGYSIDVLLPIVSATSAAHPANALTFTGSFVYGQAIGDLYTGLSGGAAFAGLPPSSTGAAQTYPQDIDNGLVAYTADGVLHAIRWRSYMLGLQYYLPTPIRMWVAGNYSHMYSSDLAALQTASNATKMFNKSDWADANLFVDASAAVRFGLEYAYFRQTYLDGTTGTNNRVQFSAFYIF